MCICGKEQGWEKERSAGLQAQPTQRRKTTSTLLPPPSTSLPSLSLGAGPPTFGHSGATATGGGAGESHAWAVRGSFFTVIHLGHAEASSRSSLAGPVAADLVSLLDFGDSDEEKLRTSLGMPNFFMASFVPRLENILVVLVGAKSSVSQCVSAS